MVVGNLTPRTYIFFKLRLKRTYHKTGLHDNKTQSLIFFEWSKMKTSPKSLLILGLAVSIAQEMRDANLGIIMPNLISDETRMRQEF
jgi:hypothetical protein